MTDRLRFISHEGKQILLVDFSNCSAAEVEKVCRAVPELVTTLPRNSVLILSDFFLHGIHLYVRRRRSAGARGSEDRQAHRGRHRGDPGERGGEVAVSHSWFPSMGNLVLAAAGADAPRGGT